MSTSVCQPVGFVPRRDRNYSDLPKVKRALFCLDHDVAARFVKYELSKEMKVNSVRWNFDFETESPLDPNGTYIWQRVERNYLPVTPMKKKLPEDDGVESEDYYFQPIEPIREETPRSQGRIQQRLITDYMQTTKKRVATDAFKKSSERPVKIPRFNELS